MARHKTHPRLRIYQNNQFVGYFSKQPSGALEFEYDDSWLNNPDAYPVSLSLPLREDAFKGEPVAAVFENLLPDSDVLRARVAERVGAAGTDAYSLLLQVGRDCAGALQFVPNTDGAEGIDTSGIKGEVVDEQDIEKILKNLTRAPLGLDQEDDFRISVAGAQEKTALLLYEGKWLRPHGTTPTTHILKTQIGALPNGIDLSDSVENEFYGLKVMAAFGLPINKAEIVTFGMTKSLVIQRFDRRWTKQGRLIRIPQEDCCQALSVPPTQKYQNQGGPGMVDILNLLKGSDTPAENQKTFLKAQVLFWLMGATDGHAKNFSIFLGAGGRFHLTPMYDVLTVLPYCAARQIETKKIKMAMSVGSNSHYKMSEIQGRHFMQTTDKAGVPAYIVKEALEEIYDTAKDAFNDIEKNLPNDFPEQIHKTVQKAFLTNVKNIKSQD